MSVQAGIMSFDGRDIPRREIEFLLHGLEERGPDYSDIHVSGALAMGFRGLLIAPEDKKDQPLRSSSGVALTFDGRLDRRKDVAHRVGLSEATTVSDVTLVLMAYDQSGARCFEQLMGEFAFVLWDEQRRSLFMVRSLCGTRPLFYMHTNNYIVWSSEVDDLVVKSDVSPLVNDNYIFGLAYFQPDVDESPFTNFSVVPSGTYIEVAQAGRRKSPVSTWHPEKLSTLYLPSEADYEEAWRQQVALAIGDKLRLRTSVFSELSGGLDSSTIVMMADRVLSSAGRDPSMLTTVSSTYETSKNCDDTVFIVAVEEARTGKGTHLSESSLRITLGLNDIKFAGAPSMHHIFPGMYEAIVELMRAARCRVLFTGNGGDELFWSDPTSSPELADLLVQGRLACLISRARQWSQIGGMPLWKLLLTAAVGPITLGTRFARLGSLQLPTLCPPNTAQWRRWVARPGCKFGLRINDHVGLPSRRARVFSVLSYRALLSSGSLRECHGIYFSHPFSHRQLIDFMLSLPMDQIVRPGEGRSLMRRAMRGILPERIRLRKSKAGPDECFCRVLAREKDTIGDLAKLLICERGYTGAQSFAEAIREVSLGRIEQSGAVMQLLSVERWLRSLSMINSLRSTLKASFPAYGVSVNAVQ